MSSLHGAGCDDHVGCIVRASLGFNLKTLATGPVLIPVTFTPVRTGKFLALA